MKYIILFTLLFIPIICNAIEFEITTKRWAERSQQKLKSEGHKIKDIVPLDNEAEGYVKIIYE